MVLKQSADTEAHTSEDKAYTIFSQSEEGKQFAPQLVHSNARYRVIIMSYMYYGMTLDKYKTKNDKNAAQVACNVRDAVLTMHKLGILHRDLKPQNILVDPTTLKVALIDFEMSFFFNRLDQNTSACHCACGTPDWIPHSVQLKEEWSSNIECESLLWIVISVLMPKYRDVLRWFKEGAKMELDNEEKLNKLWDEKVKRRNAKKGIVNNSDEEKMKLEMEKQRWIEEKAHKFRHEEVYRRMGDLKQKFLEGDKWPPRSRWAPKYLFIASMKRIIKLAVISFQSPPSVVRAEIMKSVEKFRKTAA